MLYQLAIAVLLILGVIGCFRLQLWCRTCFYGQAANEVTLREQTDRQRVRYWAQVGAIFGASTVFAGISFITMLAVTSTGHPPSGHIVWSILLGIVFVPGGGLLGNIVGTVFSQLVIVLRRSQND